MTETSGYYGMVSIYGTNDDGNDITWPIYTSELYPTKEGVFNEFDGNCELMRALVEESREFNDFEYDYGNDRADDECAKRFAGMLNEMREHFSGKDGTMYAFDSEDIQISVCRQTIHTEPKKCYYCIITNSDPSSGRLFYNTSVYSSREDVLRELLEHIAEIGAEIAEYDDDVHYIGDEEYEPGMEYSDEQERWDFNEDSLRSWLEKCAETGRYGNGLIEARMVSGELQK